MFTKEQIDEMLRGASVAERRNVDDEYLTSHDSDVDDVCCYVRALAAEVKRLRAMIEQTADGALVPDCDRMFCPKCGSEVRLEYDLAYCDECPNPDSGEAYPTPPLPLSFGSCYSTREAAEAARSKASS